MRLPRMQTRIAVLTAATVLTVIAIQNEPLAQAAPNLTGSWAPMQGGRGGDPKTAPPAATH